MSPEDEAIGMVVQDGFRPPIVETSCSRKLFSETWSANVGCLPFTKFRWVGKHISIITKPTNSPTHGQPNPSKNTVR